MAQVKQMTTTQSLLAELNANQGMRERFEAAPMETLAEVADNHLPNTPVYRMVVGALGLGLLISLVAVAWIAIGSEVDVPPLFATVASTIVGALAGLLAPQP